MTQVQREPAVTALVGLLDEFRNKRIVAPSAEEKGMVQHAGSLSAPWNERFPGFPSDLFPYASSRGEYYLKEDEGLCSI